MSDFKPLPTGLYNIRPADGRPGPVPGGMYVTGNGHGKPLILSAQRPPESERQMWLVLHNEKTNQYVLNLIQTDGSDGDGFSWDGRITPESRVILGKPQQFTISPQPDNSYLIRPDVPIIGVEICVGVDNHGRELQFKFFPVHAPPVPKPLWCFTRVG